MAARTRDNVPSLSLRPPIVAFGTACLLLAWLAIPPSAAAATRARQENLTSRDVRWQFAVSAGGNHACAVRNDGTVRCWGENGQGQIGDGTSTDRLSPANVSGITTAVAVSAGGAHTCALRVDGTVRCWGRGANGQLGNNSTAERRSPVTVSGLSTAVAIAAGRDHTCALLHDGAVRCWGSNSSGQLGDGTTTNRLTPVTVSGLSGVTALTAGGFHTCAQRADATARCWGLNNLGQLGDGTTTDRLTPVTVSSQSSTVAISAGGNHTCAVRAEGSVRCWGRNFFGQVGDGTFDNRPGGAFVQPEPDDVVTVTSGADHTCMLRAGGTARCWGFNVSGQLGDGTATNHSRAETTVVGLTGAVALAAGGSHTCAMLTDGALRCWGSNSSGQLGDGTGASSLTPNVVAGGAGGISARNVIAASFHTCAARASGAVACWGRDMGGDGSTDALSPVAVPGLAGADIVTAGIQHSCARTGAGQVHCWGRNEFGQLGDGTTTDRLTPSAVTNGAGPLGDVAGVVAGTRHTCAMTASGEVRCWGDNDSGQLGDGTTTDRLIPVSVSSSFNEVAVAPGGFHSCALRVDGTVRCWGLNADGQVGDGTTADRLTPRDVTGLTDIIAIATGQRHSCALRVDGVVRCWGLSESGQVGDGTRTNRTAPVPVTGLTGVVAITAGNFHTCALLFDGRARCWGEGSSGRLGDGTENDRLTPVNVSNLSNIVSISAGGFHTCAVRVDGGVFCWGFNQDGQVGDGTTTERRSRVEVASFRANVDPAAEFASNGHRVLLTALINCPVDYKVTIEMALLQGEVLGVGTGKGKCVGGLAEYPVQVSVRQGAPFALGPAQAEITATVRDGHKVIDVQEWSRTVEIEDDTP